MATQPPRQRRGTLINHQVKEIVQNHKQCMNLIKARFSTIFFLTLVFSLLEANKIVIDVGFFYGGLTNDDVKAVRDIWYLTYGKHAIYLAMQIPAGRLAELLGSKWILFTSLAGSGLCLCLMPVVLDFANSVLGLHVLYLVEYLFLGFAVPSIQAMLARWAIPSERILMASIVYSSYPLGRSVGVMLSVWLCSVFIWQVTFYVFSVLCLILLVFWTIFVHDNYESPRARITKQERKVMVREMTGQLYHYKDKKYSCLPMKEILQCRPLWAVLVAQMTHFYCEAQYSTPVEVNLARLKMGADNTTRIGGIGSVNSAVIIAQPYYWSAVLTWILGLVFFNLVSGRIFTKIGAYRVGCAVSIVGIAITTILECLDNRRTKRVNMLYDQIVMSTLAGLLSTCNAPYLDMAPNYAGTIVAIHTIIMAIPRQVFYISFADVLVMNYIGYALLLTVVMMSVFFYLFYVTDNLMDWNNFPLDNRHIERPSIRRRSHDHHTVRRSSSHGRRHVSQAGEQVVDPNVQYTMVQHSVPSVDLSLDNKGVEAGKSPDEGTAPVKP